MRNTLLIIIILFSLGCSSTQRQNYYLRRSKINLAKAVALGAKLDSTKTIIHDTVSIDKIHDRIVRVTKYDTLKLQALCPEAKTLVQKKAIQKLICPDVVKDTIYTLYAKAGNKKYAFPIHIIASSIGGTASLQIDSKEFDIPYIKETVQINAEPANMPTFTGKLLRSAGLLLLGIIIGFILGKVLKFGVNL